GGEAATGNGHDHFGVVVHVHDQLDFFELFAFAEIHCLVITGKCAREFDDLGLSAIGFDEHACVGTTQNLLHTDSSGARGVPPVGTRVYRTSEVSEWDSVAPVSQN